MVFKMDGPSLYKKINKTVASKSAKEDADTYNKETSDKIDEEETERINTTPNTRPPLFSDDAHDKVKKKGVPCKKCGCSKCGK